MPFSISMDESRQKFDNSSKKVNNTRSYTYVSISRPSTEIRFKNKTRTRLRVKIDCDRELDSIVMNSVDASSEDMNEYEAYYIVDTSISFTIVNPGELKSFFPQDGNTLHAFITIMKENEDGK